ncbi:hypothetical protein GOP47_0012024 [Adiantum capillus-veneris]|uniref:Uncharacterized protein n=1 Tax=Adiantum capillus-veneris TaxID=13818 RepID=A0A9D4UUB1_ADICA|nr:hypothetical protein GOP47_0012024 [Adiantum capillus-veneris]
MPLYSPADILHPKPHRITQTRTLFANLHTMDSSMRNHDYPHSHMSTSTINPPTNHCTPTPLDANNFPTCKCTHIVRRYTPRPHTTQLTQSFPPSLFAHTHNLSGANATTDSLQETREKRQFEFKTLKTTTNTLCITSKTWEYNDGIAWRPPLLFHKPIATSSLEPAALLLGNCRL